MYSWLKQCPRSAPPGAKLITQRFYACFRSAAEGDHPLQDTHQHGGWITRPRLVPAVPYRTAAANRPLPPRHAEVAASERLIWSKEHGTRLSRYHLPLYQYRCFRCKFYS